MLISDKFYAVNIREYFAWGDDPEAGEPALVKLLPEFSCPKNPDVERFLKKYRNNCFTQFDTRQTTSGADEPHELVQFLRLI